MQNKDFDHGSQYRIITDYKNDPKPHQPFYDYEEVSTDDDDFMEGSGYQPDIYKYPISDIIIPSIIKPTEVKIRQRW